MDYIEAIQKTEEYAEVIKYDKRGRMLLGGCVTLLATLVLGIILYDNMTGKFGMGATDKAFIAVLTVAMMFMAFIYVGKPGRPAVKPFLGVGVVKHVYESPVYSKFPRMISGIRFSYGVELKASNMDIPKELFHVKDLKHSDEKRYKTGDTILLFRTESADIYAAGFAKQNIKEESEE